MQISLTDTRRRRKAPFAPIDPGNVRMYVCGPTVYDDAHIGNARPVIVFDVLFRLLRHVYGADAVTYVRNVTDVDDKINARAARDAVITTEAVFATLVLREERPADLAETRFGHGSDVNGGFDVELHQAQNMGLLVARQQLVEALVSLQLLHHLGAGLAHAFPGEGVECGLVEEVGAGKINPRILGEEFF